MKVKSLPILRTAFAAAVSFALLGVSGIGSPLQALAEEGPKTKATAPAPAPAPAAGKDSLKEEDEPPTTLVSPSQDTADSDSDADAAKAAADSNHCTQCQIQLDAYRKLKAESDDANDNLKKNQAVQAKLKPDEDKSAWIKVESNLRMWDIKIESLKKNLSALEAQMKQDCQGCPQAPDTAPSNEGTPKK